MALMAREQPDTHAGGIVYRQTERGPEYLIVRARRDPTAWVLPKGHIEAGELPEAAAVREVREESGCLAAIVAPLGRLAFGNVRTRVYLMRFERQVDGGEGREVFWGSAQEAGTRLVFEDTRALLARAHERVTAGPGHD
jgi:8-oxo-dGTP pyrophosphatase MutT (NUDIX family)